MISTERETTQTQIAVAGDGRKAERLKMCEEKMRRNFLGIAESLAKIKSGRLYEGAGFRNFYDYCSQRWKLSKASTKRALSAAPILQALPKTAPFGATIRETHLRPLYGMRPASAAKILQRALAAAPLDKYGQPRLTRKLVEQTARDSGWKPEPEFIADQRAARTGQSSVAAKAPGQRQLEAGFKKIVTEFSPEESVDKYGAAETWDWFPQLIDWMERARATKP